MVTDYAGFFSGNAPKDIPVVNYPNESITDFFPD
jgi:hypothetical protein